MSPAASQSQRKCPFQLCDGSGWRETWALWTPHGGEYSYIEKTPITREQYEHLGRTIDWNKQQTYAGRYRCKCHPPREAPEPKKKGKGVVA